MHRFSEGKKEERFTFQVHRIWCCIILLLWAVTLQALHKAMQQFLAGLLAMQQNTDRHRRERKSNGKNPTFFWISIIIITDTQSIHTLGTKVADTSLSAYWFSVLLTPINLLIQCLPAQGHLRVRLHHQPMDNRMHACMIKCLPACVAKHQLPTDLVMQGEERGITQDHSQARRWRGWSGRTVWEPADRRHRESSLPPAHGGLVSCWISQTWNRNQQVRVLTSVPQRVYFCLTPHPSVYLLLS